MDFVQVIHALKTIKNIVLKRRTAKSADYILKSV